MSFLPDEIPLIVLVLMVWFFVSLLLAPLEALGWWAGWFEGDEEEAESDAINPEEKRQQPENTEAYLVYLTGISGVSGDTLLEEEAAFLERLDEALPNVIVIKDVYPYSVRNRALTGQRVFAWFWRFALQMKLSGKPRQRIIGLLINLRNAFQVMVSADRRYGPIYNTSFASLIAQSLSQHGYERGSGMPIYLLGYSGGGQMAVGTVPYLKKLCVAPVTVVSLGGTISGDPGVIEVERLYHLYGKRDGVQRLGWLLSPSRWQVGEAQFLPLSRWNQAYRAGKMEFIQVGDMKHNGKQGYLDDVHHADGSNRSNVETVVDTITEIVMQNTTPPDQAA